MFEGLGKGHEIPHHGLVAEVLWKRGNPLVEKFDDVDAEIPESPFAPLLLLLLSLRIGVSTFTFTLNFLRQNL